MAHYEASLNSSTIDDTATLRQQTDVDEAEEDLLDEYEGDFQLRPNAHIAAFFSCIPIFSGYACLVSLQERIRRHMGISGKSAEADTFDLAVSSLFYTILAVRFLHNIVLSALRPRERVCVGYLLVVTSLSLIALLIFLLEYKTHLWLIFVAYTLGGIGISVFECNFLATITPVGAITKKWGIAAMPVGYSGLSIGMFAFFWARPHDEAFVWIVLVFVAIFNLCGLYIYVTYIPDLHFEASEEVTLREFLDLFVNHWRDWVLPLVPNFVAFFLDMFTVILLSGAPEYVYNVPEVPLLARHLTHNTNSSSSSSSSPTIGKNLFLCIFNICGCLGDFLSRVICYKYVKNLTWFSTTPLEIVLLTIMGGALTMSRLAVLAWPGMFLTMFSNGFIYASTMRRIDQKKRLDRKFNLLALSMWLLVGDAGSSIGSSLTHTLSRAVGTAG